MKYLLDTNTISELISPQPNEKVVSWLKAQDASLLFIATISIYEIWRGISKLPNSKRKITLMDWFQHDLQVNFENQVLPFSFETAVYAAEIVTRLEKAGTPVGVFDCLIAATAFEHDCTIITRNERHFRYTELPVLNLWE